MEADNGPAVVDPLFGSQAMSAFDPKRTSGKSGVGKRGNQRFGLQLV